MEKGVLFFLCVLLCLKSIYGSNIIKIVGIYIIFDSF